MANKYVTRSFTFVNDALYITEIRLSETFPRVSSAVSAIYFFHLVKFLSYRTGHSGYVLRFKIDWLASEKLPSERIAERR